MKAYPLLLSAALLAGCQSSTTDTAQAGNASAAALLLPPAWGLLAAGILGGTLAFLIGWHRARG